MCCGFVQLWCAGTNNYIKKKITIIIIVNNGHILSNLFLLVMSTEGMAALKSAAYGYYMFSSVP